MQNSSDQLVFERNMTIPIEYVENWKLVFQHKQAQIDKDNKG